MRQVREERQESREEFARSVQVCCGEPCDERTVKRWEDGTVRLPRPVYRRAAIELTGRSAEELGWSISRAELPDALDGASGAAGPGVDADSLLGSLRKAEVAARSTAGVSRNATFRALAHAYHACAVALTAVGEHAAAWVAADRAVAAAEAAGDELLMAEGAVRLAALFAGTGSLDRAQRAAETAAAALTSRADSGELAARELSYALHVQLATVAANQNRNADATRHATRARLVRIELSDPRNH